MVDWSRHLHQLLSPEFLVGGASARNAVFVPSGGDALTLEE